MQIVPRSARPKRLVLLRHGRTEWNRVGRVQGHADVSLDDVGLAQAKHAAQHLTTYDPVVVWSSDLARARETAEQVAAATGLDVEYDKRLREYDVGIRQGLTFEEFEQRFPELYAGFKRGEGFRVPGAETHADVAERMTAALNAAAEALGEHDTGVIVGHGASLRVGMLAFLDLPLDKGSILAGMANGAWAVLEQHPHRGWQIMDYNAQTILEPFDLADDLSPR
jgi:glucosyl-3-phosphoglycerate phosphatase